MIDYLSGILIQRHPARLVINVGGVGFGVDVSLRASEAFPNIGEKVELSTWLYVKEGILELYGFTDPSEKEIFLKLIGVSGIGPRLGLRILSESSPERLAGMIRDADIRGLTALKGIGKKTAEMLVASLRTAVSKMIFTPSGQASAPSPLGEHERDAVLALIALGVKDAQAQAAVAKSRQKLGETAGASQLIAQALQEV